MTASILLLFGWLLLLLLARRQFFHIALLGFPGVIMHECMHLMVGVLLLAKPVSMNLIPHKSGSQWQFGSVSFTGLNLLNAAPVAFAPLFLLGLAWLMFYHWMIPAWNLEEYPIWLGVGYLTASALVYSVPSVTDMKVGGWSTLFWAATGATGWWLWTYLPGLA